MDKSRRRNLWLFHARRYPVRYALILSSIFASMVPALVMLVGVTYAFKQLNSRPGNVPWSDLIGEHASRWLIPIVRNTRLEDGVPLDFQMQYAVWILVIAGTINCVLKVFQEYLLEDLGEKIARDLRFAVSDTYLGLNYDGARKMSSGVVASMVGDDAREVRQAFTRICGSLVSDFLFSFLYLAWLVILDTQLFILFVTILLPAGIVLRYTGRLLRRLSRFGIDAQSQLLGLILEKMRGWQTIQTHRAFAFETKRFNETNESLFQSWRRAARARALSTPLVEWLGMIAGAFVVVIALRRIAEDALSSNVLTGFLVTVSVLSTSVQAITSQLQSTKRASASLRRIHEFIGMSWNQSWSEASLLQPAPQRSGNKRLTRVDAIGIELADPLGHPLAKNVSFSLRRGDVCVLVGPSGCGKSSLLRTLLGLQAPKAGIVQLNGDTADEQLFEGFSKEIAFLPQDAFVFDGTLLENICYPQSPETLSESDRARAARALERARLEQPSHAHVSGLSGGEKQRLMFARVFYNDPQFVVLDESTSALDEQTERAILSELFRNRNETIVLAVSHRDMIKEYASQIVDLTRFKEQS